MCIRDRYYTWCLKSVSYDAEASAFLLELRDLADPMDLDYPDDRELADGTANQLGERMKNINKASAACDQLIEVTAGC